jgi:ATP-binding cassette subfamily F protein 3
VRSVANVTYEVKDGRVRKFPGEFDYYLAKKDEDRFVPEKKAHIAPQKPKTDEAKEKAKEEEKRRREEEKKRKSHNAGIREAINKLEKKKEKLQLESYAKARALSNPKIFRDEETAKAYGRRLKEIERLAAEIDEEIKGLESQIIP